MASGLMELKGAKGGTYYHYTLGTSIGDRSYDSPVSSLKLGNWYYVALVDGDVVAVLPVSRWAPDLDLRMHMPAGEANRF